MNSNILDFLPYSFYTSLWILTTYLYCYKAILRETSKTKLILQWKTIENAIRETSDKTFLRPVCNRTEWIFTTVALKCDVCNIKTALHLMCIPKTQPAWHNMFLYLTLSLFLSLLACMTLVTVNLEFCGPGNDVCSSNPESAEMSFCN